MGAWGSGFFQNDDAMDFLSNLDEVDSLLPIREILDLDLDELLEAPDCAAALAAAEILTIVTGNADPDLTEDVLSACPRLDQPEKQLIARAWVVADAIQMSSELKELWKESDEYTDWVHLVEGLKQRLAHAAH